MDQQNPQTWQDQFTPEQVETIKRYWHHPPPNCKGTCHIVASMFMENCTACGWDDYGAPLELQ